MNEELDVFDLQLFTAAATGDHSFIKFLVRLGVDVNKRDENGNTPRMISSMNGQNQCLSACIEAGADVNSTNDDGDTTLISAAKLGHKECVSALILAGADVNAIGQRNNTALMWASDDYESLAALIQAGADVNLKNVNGYTGLKVATVAGNIKCVRLLIQAGADTKNILIENVIHVAADVNITEQK